MSREAARTVSPDEATMTGGAGSPDELLDRINRAWLEGRPEDLAPLLDHDVVMVFPGFAGRSEGKAAMIAGFEDFCTTAKVRHFAETDRQIDVRGTTAVASFAFDMIYDREGASYRSTGRDLWVFERKDGRWLALWRTMLDLKEEPVS